MLKNCVAVWLSLATILILIQGCLFQEFHFPSLNTDDMVQTVSARAVAARLLHSKANLFNIQVNKAIKIDNKATFQIMKDIITGSVNITGSSGVAACWGLHHYLKHYCHCHVSWDGDQLDLPSTLPNVNYTINAMDVYRYYQNVVTTSYSFVWWDWLRWQREIDWMALNGINLALAFTGQEAIWERVYLELNLTQLEIREHFCGPAFLAWCRMGNIRGWGGPLTRSWHTRMLNLQRKIMSSMNELGIIPILPAFAGHVPRAFERLFPHANMTKMKRWNKFVDRYCCPYLLDPTDELFHRIGTMFMRELLTEFGTGHFYNCDTFNEMLPQSGDVTYLGNISAAIFRAMTEVDTHAVWILQGWTFYSEAMFWNVDRVRALVTSVPTGRMIVLDLQSELNPQYFRLSSYFGQPFIWCHLHNFGGTLGLYGAVNNINNGIFEARAMNGSSMIGIGLTPEGINQNYVVYDLVLDLMWRRESVNLTSWFSSYAFRRYGSLPSSVDSAWQLLRSSVYNFTGLRKVRGKYIICLRPSLHHKPWYWYNTTQLKMAWDGFVNAIPELGSSHLFQHDLIDVTRQTLQILGDGFYSRIVQSFYRKNISSFQQNADRFLDVLWNMEEILQTSNNFLLGSWLNGAKKIATSPVEEAVYEFNARNQITLWGPLGEIKDYATKQWSGVVSSYYLPRWQLFLDYLSFSLHDRLPFNQSTFVADVFENVEQAFTLDTSIFPDTPQGKTTEMAQILYSRWRNITVWEELGKYEEYQSPFSYYVDDDYNSVDGDDDADNQSIPHVIQV